jgi:hypothetical protein
MMTAAQFAVAFLLAAAAGTAGTPDETRSQPAGAQGGQLSCEPKVVPCNYAHHYTGQFGWQITLQAAGTGSSYTEVVTIGISNRVVTCNGTATDIDHGQAKIGRIVGPGLLAVEFKTDSTGRLVYNITAACPSPAFPGETVKPAELGHNEEQSYDQPATAIGMKNLKGGSTYPNPDSDALNGVTGTVTVSWDFKRP